MLMIVAFQILHVSNISHKTQLLLIVQLYNNAKPVMEIHHHMVNLVTVLLNNTHIIMRKNMELLVELYQLIYFLYVKIFNLFIK